MQTTLPATGFNVPTVCPSEAFENVTSTARWP
jgi:hypothetical protein